MLRATFVRAAGERDRIYVTRSDGSEVSWSLASYMGTGCYGDGLPHDLVHLVVEACYGLRFGFWGRVDAGADPARINAEANRVGGAQKYREFGTDQAELHLAEALAGAAWWLDGVTHEQLDESVAAQCRRLGVPVPDVSVGRIARIQGRLRSLGRRWRALPARGSITLSFWTDQPERALDELEG
jgi:hypothetical protein